MSDDKHAVSLTDLAKSTQKRPGRPRGSGFLQELSVRLSSGGDTVDRLFFQIKDSVMKRAGFKHGDALDIVFDHAERRGVIYKRDGGYSLFRSSRTCFDGKMLIPYVADSGFPDFSSQTELKVIEAKNDMIAFAVPDKKSYAAKAIKFLESLDGSGGEG